jgi:hypothetical protein
VTEGNSAPLNGGFVAPMALLGAVYPSLGGVP